jgi:PAS domain S-box-containing protein
MPSNKDLKILIVDDISENIFALAALLKKSNFIFDTASSGKQALEMLLKNEYGLILLDVQMPDMDGFEVASYLKDNERTKNIPIIFISALATGKDFYKKGLSLGAVDYIAKPFDSDLLVLKINNMLQLAYTEKKLKQSVLSVNKLNDELKEKAIQNEFSYNAMFYNSPDLMLVLNKQGEIIRCNQEYINFGDLSSEQILGKTFLEIPFPFTFLNSDYSPENILLKAFSKVENINENILVRVDDTKQGTLYYELNFIRIKSEIGENMLLAILKNVTEKKRAEEKLEQERVFFKKILDSFPHGIYIVNKEYEIQYLNPLAKEMFGEQSTNKCYKYFHKTDSPCSFCKNENVFKGEKITWQWESPKKDLFLELTDIPLKNNEGVIESKLEIIQDITERKNAEKRLKKSEEKYRNLFEKVKEGIIVSSPIGVIEMVNSALCEMLGYTKQELVGKIGYDFLLPKEEIVYLKQKIENRKEGVSETYETKMIKKNGEIIWVQISASPVFFDSGNFYGVMSFVSDITEIKKATQQLIDNEKFVRGVFDSMGSHIAVIDKAGKILITNNAWKKFGLENGITLERSSEGTNYFEVCRNAIKSGDRLAAKILIELRKILNNKSTSFQIEYPCHSPTVKRWFLLSANLFDGNETLVVLRHVDITERKEQQSIIANAAIQSQEAEKQRIAQELHDNVGQKLMALKLYYKALEQYVTKNNDSKEMLSNIFKIENDIIKEIRSLSHSLVLPEFSDFGLYESVKAMVEQLDAVLPIKCTVQKKGKEIEPANIEKINIYRSIQEFLNNSIKHSDATHINVFFSYSKKQFKISITDNGKGFIIEDANKNKTGLGVINIMHRLQSINCNYDYNSTLGKGTELCIIVDLKD